MANVEELFEELHLNAAPAAPAPAAPAPAAPAPAPAAPAPAAPAPPAPAAPAPAPAAPVGYHYVHIDIRSLDRATNLYAENRAAVGRAVNTYMIGHGAEDPRRDVQGNRHYELWRVPATFDWNGFMQAMPINQFGYEIKVLRIIDNNHDMREIKVQKPFKIMSTL